MPTLKHRISWRSLPWLAALLLLPLASAAFAQAEADPPGRAAFMSVRQGSVVYAPQGEDEWLELPQNRPLTVGDRIWSDRGSRAELQLGSATLHVDGESHLGFSDLDDRSAQFILQQGTVNARVRDLTQGENFEIDTPNIALRALLPGDYRVDVDPQDGTTRVAVASGLAAVFGEGGESMQLGAGQQAAFAGRSLAQVRLPTDRQDDFDQWVAERNRLEDQSIAARYVPRGVVGYAQLDAYGSWSQDPSYGAVWYPQVPMQDWAPYRYGHWAWVQPWGWTWVDDAPWGFAPFHYGRWTMIGHRWAWVPGHLAARPIYSPALVVFIGGGGTQVGLNFGTGPAVGWYPLAPGEAWWPWYRTSPRYVNFANFNINLHRYPRHFHDHMWRQRPHAITAVRDDDFRRGRPVHRHWQRVEPRLLANAPVGVAPQRPEFRREREAQPRLRAAPPAAVQPAMPARNWGRDFVPPAVREQHRAEREQERLQRDAERAARRQIREAEEQRGEFQFRRQPSQPFFRQQQEVLRQQEAVRQQEVVRQRQEQQRVQREAWQQRQQQAREAQQRPQMEFERQRQAMPPPRAIAPPQRVMVPQQVVPAQAQPPQQAQRQQGVPILREHGAGRADHRMNRDGRGRERNDDDNGRRGGWQR